MRQIHYNANRKYCRHGRIWQIHPHQGAVSYTHLQFDRNGIEIPYNQLDVHLKKDNQDAAAKK